MAKGDWWFKFDILRWRNAPELRKCSLSTRGFWLECIAIMHHSGTANLTESIEDLALLVGCSEAEAEKCIEELKRTKTADVTLRNKSVTVKSRKYAKELKAKELTKLRVRKHRKTKDVTPEKRVRDISKKLEVKEEDKEGVPPPADKPDDTPVDHRRNHPAIVALHAVSGIYPPREIWDELIDQLGFEIDAVKLKNCYTKWRARGFNKTNYDWAVDWYLNGIPAQGKFNGTTKRNQGTSQSRETTTDRLAATADIISKYPTEAELRAQGLR